LISCSVNNLFAYYFKVLNFWLLSSCLNHHRIYCNLCLCWVSNYHERDRGPIYCICQGCVFANHLLRSNKDISLRWRTIIKSTNGHLRFFAHLICAVLNIDHRCFQSFKFAVLSHVNKHFRNFDIAFFYLVMHLSFNIVLCYLSKLLNISCHMIYGCFFKSKGGTSLSRSSSGNLVLEEGLQSDGS